jgi:hypothetical protein
MFPRGTTLLPARAEILRHLAVKWQGTIDW